MNICTYIYIIQILDIYVYIYIYIRIFWKTERTHNLQLATCTDTLYTWIIGKLKGNRS